MAEQRPGAALIPAALVVPILDEASTLPRLLAGITAQTRRPAEVLFVDGGSQDQSAALIEQWWRDHGWGGGRCEVIANPGGRPGGNRNVGVQNAHAPWIAFLDGGIEPAADWLQTLFDCATQANARAVSGVCRFDSESAVGKAVCALSAGVQREYRVLPASIFRRDLFDEVGPFRTALRSAEDLEWLQRLTVAGIQRLDCPSARVDYRHFPATFSAAIRKWYVYETNTTRAGVRRTQQNGYLAAAALWLAAAIYSPLLGTFSFAAYAVLRGILDPMRRSRRIAWWHGMPPAFAYAVVLGPALDLAKLAGIVASLPARFSSHME